MNRADEFSPDNEVERKLKVTSNGRVRYTRMFRMRSMMGTHIQRYPYDIQLAELIISSADYSDSKIRTRLSEYCISLWKDYFLTCLKPITRLNTTKWETSILQETNGWITEENKLKELEYKYYNSNPGWSLIGVKVTNGALSDNVAKANYSTVTVTLAFRRNHQFYTLTLIVPVIVLSFLTPIGLIMPGTQKSRKNK